MRKKWVPNGESLSSVAWLNVGQVNQRQEYSMQQYNAVTNHSCQNCPLGGAKLVNNKNFLKEGTFMNESLPRKQQVGVTLAAASGQNEVDKCSSLPEKKLPIEFTMTSTTFTLAYFWPRFSDKLLAIDHHLSGGCLSRFVFIRWLNLRSLRRALSSNSQTLMQFKDY